MGAWQLSPPHREAEVAPVNDRMPLVLTSEAQYARRLDPGITTRQPLKTAMQAIEDGVLQSRPLKKVD